MVLRLSIAKKFIFAFLLVSIIPLCVMGYWSLRSMRSIDRTAVRSSAAQLEREARVALELRAIELASRVTQTLRSCESDLLTLKMLPRDPEIYRQFSIDHRGSIWTRELDNGITRAVHKEIPLYEGIAFIGADGIERIRIVEDRILGPSHLREVSKPENTTYRTERYFEEASKLKSGQIWVSHLTGWYVNRAESLRGRRYKGVIRFATPCRDDRGRLEGVLVLSLDSRRLMELVSHVLPSGKQSGFPTYSSGNYAFMFDDQGWIISHPKPSDIRGVLPDGSSFSTDPKFYTRNRLLAGQVPFNLDHVRFINPNYQLIAREVRALHSGVTSTFNVAGTPRIMAYAPILYNSPPYNRYGIFGGITVGLETEKFKQPALLASFKIDEMVERTKRNSLLILACSALLAIGLALMLSRTLTRPILSLAAKAREIAAGRIVDEAAVRTGDELEVLADNFAYMTRQVLEHRKSLEKSLSELARSKLAVEGHMEQLEKQLRVLNNIHYLSQYLSTVYDRDQVLGTVLRTCVEGLGFDRAILYLFDDQTRQLVCNRTFGFSPDDEKRAAAVSYSLDRHACIPTRVFREGKTIFVRDIRSEETATPLDLRISEVSKTDSFIFTPVITRDRVIGVLGADTKICRREIGDIDVESLQILANDAARAIERSDLYSSLLGQRNFVESIITHITNGIITLDESGAITWFNPYSEKVFGIDRQSATGRNYRAVFAELPSWVEVIERYLASSTVKQGPVEYRCPFPNAREKVLEVYLSTIYHERRRENVFLIIVRDVTQRKLMEEHIRRSDRLVSLGVLAAGVAHEIRNPLTGISLLMDDLHDRLHDLPKERELIRRSLQEIDRLENLTNGLLEFAVPSRQINLELRPVGEVVHNTFFLVRKLCKNNNVSLSLQSDEALPLLRLDREKLQQALLNLLMNGVQAMPEGGELKIEVTEVAAEESLLSKPAVRILVQDTGKGISPEDIPYVFDPFFSRNPSGCGLGLAIVHGIVQEHGGKISLSSELGKGTIFWMDLPVKA